MNYSGLCFLNFSLAVSNLFGDPCFRAENFPNLGNYFSNQWRDAHIALYQNYPIESNYYREDQLPKTEPNLSLLAYEPIQPPTGPNRYYSQSNFAASADTESPQPASFPQEKEESIAFSQSGNQDIQSDSISRTSPESNASPQDNVSYTPYDTRSYSSQTDDSATSPPSAYETSFYNPNMSPQTGESNASTSLPYDTPYDPPDYSSQTNTDALTPMNYNPYYTSQPSPQMNETADSRFSDYDQNDPPSDRSYGSAQDYDSYPSSYDENTFSAASCCPTPNYSPYAVCDPCCDCNDNWEIWIYPNYLYLGYTGGRGIGYRRGYSTMGIFLAPSFLTIRRFQGFVDAKGYAFDDGKWGGSGGAGVRLILPSNNIVLGVNSYYDYRRFKRFDLNQVGVGLELLGPDWDVRVNGYIPVGQRNFREGTLFDFSYEYTAIRRRRVSAWYGVDAELGTWLKRKYPCEWFGLYVAAGPYYYTREQGRHRRLEDEDHRHRHREAFGGRARLLARFFNIVDVSVIATYDPVWHGRVQGQVTVAIPFDGSWLTNQRNDCECACPPCLLYQIAEQPVQRNGIIAADQHCNWSWDWSDKGCGCSESGRPTSHSISLSSCSNSSSDSYTNYFE
jgi:Inverse autotransporter, beta-domain